MSIPALSVVFIAALANLLSAGRSNNQIMSSIIDVDSMQTNTSLDSDREVARSNTFDSRESSPENTIDEGSIIDRIQGMEWSYPIEAIGSEFRISFKRGLVFSIDMSCKERKVLLDVPRLDPKRMKVALPDGSPPPVPSSLDVPNPKKSPFSSLAFFRFRPSKSFKDFNIIEQKRIFTIDPNGNFRFAFLSRMTPQQVRELIMGLGKYSFFLGSRYDKEFSRPDCVDAEPFPACVVNFCQCCIELVLGGKWRKDGEITDLQLRAERRTDACTDSTMTKFPLTPGILPSWGVKIFDLDLKQGDLSKTLRESKGELLDEPLPENVRQRIR